MIAALALALAASTPQVVEVLPLTDRIVMVHLDEGQVIYHRAGQKRGDDQVEVAPLDVALASELANYRISSPDDPAYAAAPHPASMGRKSKGTEFAWYVDSWVDGRTVNNRPDHVKEHWLYLVLPTAMQRGRTYSLALPFPGTYEWVYDEAKLRSEAVRVNNLGYVPDAPQKYGYLFHWAGSLGGLDLSAYEGARFRLVRQPSGETAFEGQVRFRAGADLAETMQLTDTPQGNFQAAPVYEMDFSAFGEPGEYVLAVDGVGCSFPFVIGADAYQEAYYHVTRALYHNRSGIALTRPYTEYERPAPHHPANTPGFAGRLQYTRVPFPEWGSEGGDAAALEAGIAGPLEDAWGWYQDAGDWDSYEAHLRVAHDLLTAYLARPDRFADGDLNLPESGNGVPDVLDEAAWLPRFCFRLRHELMRKGWGTGGVGLRVAGDAFGSDTGPNDVGRGSWDDVDRTWVVSGEDPVSTFRYAGAAAHLAIALRRAGTPDPEGVDWEQEARESYAWAAAHPLPDEAAMRTPRLYAAAALLHLTGEMTFAEQARLDLAAGDGYAWFEAVAAPYLIATAPGADADLRAQARQVVLRTADLSLASAETRALRWGGLFVFPMLIGHQTTPWVLELITAWALTQETDPDRAERYLGAVHTTADYFLGTNALGMTWITQVGERSPTHVFHMDSWYRPSGYHPGLIPYSPWRKERDVPTGPWDSDWGNLTVFPDINAWPGAERWWSNRCSPIGSEFTVHQNIGPAAAIYGFLSGPK